MYEIKTGDINDYIYIAENLREQDSIELALLLPNDTPKDILEYGFKESHETKIVYLDNKPVAAFGVAGKLGHEGIPWLLATPEFYKLRFSLVKHAKKVIMGWLKLFPRLTNSVIASNHKALSFIKIAGFKIECEYTYGDTKCYQFSMGVA